HVHEAVLASSETESGCTVHFVNDEYDAGPIVLQRRCPVLPHDTPDSLAERVFKEECLAYPQAIEKLMRSP
ncbi:MAG TPA: formyltransferase family protein, partial [Tepidisphaeraceae bacterium]|nr:formyltransferase family protein [Tepidisphaeraceae bacterium]